MNDSKGEDMGRRRKKKPNWKDQLKYELIGLSLLTLSLIALARLGSVGVTIVHLFRFFVGEWHITISIGLLLTSIYIIVKRKKPNFFTRRLVGIYLFVFAFLILGHLRLFEVLAGQEGFADRSVIRNTWTLYWQQVSGNTAFNNIGGGFIGAIGYATTHFLFDKVGTYLVSFFSMAIAFLLITGQSLTELFKGAYHKGKKFSGNIFQPVKSRIQNTFSNWKKSRKERKEEKQLLSEQQENRPSEPVIHDFSEQGFNGEQERVITEEPVPNVEQNEQQNDGQPPSQEPFIATESENVDYELPSIELLRLPNKVGQLNERRQVSTKAKKLEQTLESFGVKVKVTDVHIGPAVTRYEILPNVGVKVSRIVNLADDLALALAAKDIRIEAPIPGKSAIGIEVPNEEVAIVSLREVIDSPESRASQNVLEVALGRDITGEPVLAALNKMPHLLVAGATGSGKSVCINGIITSILLKAKPHEVKMVMIDPKMVELSVYNGIPHLLTPVVTEPKRASQALKKVVSEMERRYDLFSHTGTKNIEGYNELIMKENEASGEKQPTLPYIVVIVDELADLMMVAASDVEDSITRLAQMARAAGIHMILATQRPSVDVITGVIKANIPSRIAFGVSSQTDSRTILDSGGAEKLLGRGDMLYLPVGANKPKRIQGAFLSDEEVERVVQHVISQQKAQYQEEMIPTEEEPKMDEVEDELYYQAVDLVVELGTASVSMLQRRFRIGYTRAARLIDEMEARGVVGPYEGSKPREVLISKDNDNVAN